MLTVPQMFAIARGINIDNGPETCFYCSGSCGEKHSTRDYVKSSFTALDTTGGGSWVCDGCVAAMSSKVDVQLLDGEQRNNQKVRSYSWVIEAHQARAATKKHLGQLREICLYPPSTPIAIVLSDSGQKHFLYRSRIAWTRIALCVSLDGECITYQSTELACRLGLCEKVVSVVGKIVARSGDMGTSAKMKICSKFGENIIDEWARVEKQPLSRLALWLTPKKEICSAKLGN